MDDLVFVVAVSGGVDSVVLLHMMATRKAENVELIVAHYDHGIRTDSARDLELVKGLASKYGLTFESAKGNLGAKASEAEARFSRYKFLRSVRDKHQAEKIVTAHHQDDVIETMIINIIRGTGPRGLAVMNDDKEILRPLINKKKSELIDYAIAHKLEWNEDETNSDDKYLRNYIRINLIPKLKPVREKIIEINKSTNKLYIDIDLRIANILYGQIVLYRPKFVYFPYVVQREIMRQFLINKGVTEITKPVIEKAVIAAKTLVIGKKIDIDGSHWMVSEKNNLIITSK
jgi:tRNA(Ile)-lysidine synthase